MPGAGSKSHFSALSRYVALGTFVLAPFPFGSTELVWICTWNVLLAFSLLTAHLGGVTREHFRLLLPQFITLMIIAAVVLLQIWPNPPFGPVDPAWQAARDLLGLASPGRFSMTVNAPWLALGYPLLFVMALTRAFAIGTDPREARQLMLILAWAGFAYAMYGIMAQLGDPETLLFRRKEAYLGAATGTFVNRNTAATFWGSSALLFLLPLIRVLHRRDRPQAPRSNRLIDLVAYRLTSPTALAIGFAVCAVATAMTGSRAGLLLTIFAFLLAGALYLAPLRLEGLRRWGLLAGAAAASIALLQLIGGVVFGRIGAYGLIDEGRLAAYGSAIAMIREHPLLGIGFGNFEAAFPAYRTSELGSQGIWDRAHSTPLELAAEFGTPAAILIAVTCLFYLYCLFRGSLRRRRDRYIPIMGASVAMLGLLHSSVDFSLQIPGYGIFFAAVTGCALAQCFSPSNEKR